MNGNIYLLTHKCGNNFIQDIFKRPKNNIHPLKKIFFRNSKFNPYSSSYFELRPDEILDNSDF